MGRHRWTEHTQPPASAPAADATVIAPQPPAQQPPAQQQPYGQPQQPYGQPQQFGQPAWTPPPSGGSGKKLGLILGGAAVAVVVLLLLVVVLVKAVGGNGPGDVAQEYLLASFDGDVEKVCELSSEDQRGHPARGGGRRRLW